MTRLVLLDAHLLIAAYDPDAEMDAKEREEALNVVQELANDGDVKFAITPLLRFEVLCGIKNAETFTALDALLREFEVFDLRNAEADCAIGIYQLARQKNIALKNLNEPKKYKFDLLHVSSAVVNSLQFESRDKGVAKIKLLSENLTLKTHA